MNIYIFSISCYLITFPCRHIIALKQKPWTIIEDTILVYLSCLLSKYICIVLMCTCVYELNTLFTLVDILLVYYFYLYSCLLKFSLHIEKIIPNILSILVFEEVIK